MGAFRRSVRYEPGSRAIYMLGVDRVDRTCYPRGWVPEREALGAVSEVQRLEAEHVPALLLTDFGSNIPPNYGRAKCPENLSKSHEKLAKKPATIKGKLP